MGDARYGGVVGAATPGCGCFNTHIVASFAAAADAIVFLSVPLLLLILMRFGRVLFRH